ncbi:hypothetical protein [Clostridium saccharobutylicum]|uniref:Uncharacterized protein n=1 Tax=Clostridium saccharobutylicum DSM 13864 TaxID=1345695 RepID=U5MPA0_CLOSA|nr:hypothetical protein [Clostridium saccharobutylicum]AGX42624.1 hypothetical protein CLSA_c16260 [Clostridium saccharobutylicum DSM 13864]AQR89911.1 hypothetical protein CLOSC_16180 [Clostridium saccharobutylicum]AQR99816.1 hypothetical protein CSACC_16250 [Clostridium saccharobutylicum]AQS09544.1 hypothetical protein CLOBY_16730 [Clostridium saccharobutylicum]AQS13800.1 hypothetical protein CLOSACC_16250 [Clostridium saccharobutylicum]
MKKLFQVKDLIFYKEDYLGDITEYEDLIPIIEELSPDLEYEMIEIAGDNLCCDKTKKNMLVEIIGYIDESDDFITKEERDALGLAAAGKKFDLFVITVHKCTACGKWSISLLEE